MKKRSPDSPKKAYRFSAALGTFVVTPEPGTKLVTSTGKVIAFLRKRRLVGLFAATVRAAEGSKAALDDLAARLKVLLETAGPDLDRAAQRARALHRYCSAPSGDKAALRKAGAAILGISEPSFVREARRARIGAPGKPGRPGRGK